MIPCPHAIVVSIDSLMYDESRDLYIYLLLRDKTSCELMDKYIGPLLIGKQDTLTDSWGWAEDPMLRFDVEDRGPFHTAKLN